MEARVDEERKMSKGRVCVTGGAGFVASWLIMKLLHHGYSVNTTLRLRSSSQGGNRDISFLTDLPDAPEKLRIFHADLGDPETFKPALEGCVGVFHVAHPMDLVRTESTETITDITVKGILGILQACLDVGSVKRVVYTSTAATVTFNGRGHEVMVHDESSWSDVEYMRKMKFMGSSYCISKTKAEKAALEFAAQHGLDLITLIPPFIHGPFICPNLPESVKICLSMIIRDGKQFKYMKRTPFVHTDDVTEAHIHLFEHPGAKGRYICSAVEAPIEELMEFLSSRYPEYQLGNPEVISDRAADSDSLSSKKLRETGFRFKYGVEEIFGDAIRCCKQKGIL